MQNFRLLILGITVCLTACNTPVKKDETSQSTESEIECSDVKCAGFYYGPEFINGSDIAHQFSNQMSEQVGLKLKELYKAGNYSKVEFSKIKMFTVGMGSGVVTYKLLIPFESVADACDACTSFDHVGGWNHEPALIERKKQLSTALLEGEELEISNLKTTPQGLQEYWIQWKNKDLQFECVGNNP